MKRFIQLLFIVVVLALPLVSVAAQEPNPPADAGGVDLVYIGQLLQALILATVPVLAGAGVRWLVQRGNVEIAKASTEWQFALEVFAKTAVYAAEQMKLAGMIDDKLDYAVDQMQAWCDRNGLKLSIEEIRAQIEAAVLTEFNDFGFPEESEGVG